MTISYLFGDANGYGNTVQATASATEVPAAAGFWTVRFGRTSGVVSRLGRSFEGAYKRAEAFGETVQTGGSNVTGTHGTVSSGRF